MYTSVTSDFGLRWLGKCHFFHRRDWRVGRLWNNFVPLSELSGVLGIDDDKDCPKTLAEERRKWGALKDCPKTWAEDRKKLDPHGLAGGSLISSRYGSSGFFSSDNLISLWPSEHEAVFNTKIAEQPASSVTPEVEVWWSVGNWKLQAISGSWRLLGEKMGFKSPALFKYRRAIVMAVKRKRMIIGRTSPINMVWEESGSICWLFETTILKDEPARFREV